MNDTDKIVSRIEQFELHASTRTNREQYQKVRSAFESLGNIVNGGENNLVRAAMASEIIRTHRYLQGSLIIELLRGLGDLGALYDENPSRYADDRNDFVMKLCSKLRKTFKDELFYD